MDTDELDWNQKLRDQWEFHWNHHLHVGAAAASYEAWEYAGSAATALDQLEAQLDVWLAGVRGLGQVGLRVPIGAKEPYPELPMADLVLHIHRELIHHLSEVCLLRDLYLHTRLTTNGASG